MPPNSYDKETYTTIIFALLLLLQIPLGPTANDWRGGMVLYQSSGFKHIQPSHHAALWSPQNFPDAISAYNLGRYYRAPIILMDLQETQPTCGNWNKAVIMAGQSPEQELKRNWSTWR